MAKQILSGCLIGPGPNGEIIAAKNGVVKPLTFLGGTVLSFSANLGIGPTEESTLDVEVINDCKTESAIVDPQGDFFLGNIRIGSAVFFDTCDAMGIDMADFADPDDAPCFKFGGILQSYTARQSSGGLVFSARVVDPRSLLNNFTIIVSNTLQGPRKHRNFFNAYSFYEQNVLDPTEIFPPIMENDPDGTKTALKYRIVTPGGTKAKNVSGNDTYQKGNIDCDKLGKSRNNERGMPYVNIIHAINNMNGDELPLVFSSNYNTPFTPPLQGRDKSVVDFEDIRLHQDNVFEIDLSGLPNNIPPDLRAPGPSITLLDLINTVCEAVGHEFIVTLKDNGPNRLATIQIKTKDTRAFLDPASFKSTILKYNGSSIEMSYGKELKLEKSRSMLIGEQKHLMYESTGENIFMYFGVDKDGKPIFPYNAENLAEDDERRALINLNDRRNQKTCGWFIDIYLDELNGALRCPLYDYRDNQVITRKVTISEFTIRAALSSYDIWQRFAFNSLNTEDFAKVLRHNFPELEDYAAFSLIRELRAEQQARRDREQGNPPPVEPPPDHAPDADPRVGADALTDADLRLALNLAQQREAYIKQIYDFVANIGKTYYGRKYLVKAADNVCATLENIDRVNYDGPDNANNVEPQIIAYKDPCTGITTNLVANTFYPKTFTHIPTNEGAWIEDCGDVLGITKDSDGEVDEERSIYLDFFRKEDGRVGPIARIDNKLFVELIDEENEGRIIDDSDRALREAGQPVKPPSVFGGIVLKTKKNSNELDANVKFYEGMCGALDISQHSADSYVVIRDFGDCGPPPTKEQIEEDKESALTSQAYFDLPSSVFIKFSVDEDIIIDKGCRSFKKKVKQKIFQDPCCGRWVSYPFTNDSGVDPYTYNNSCYKDNQRQADQANLDCQDEFLIEEEEINIEKCNIPYIPITFDAPLLTKACDGLNTLNLEAAQLAFVNAISGFLQNNPDADDEDILGRIEKDYSNSLLFCNDIDDNAIEIAMASLDYSSTNNNKFYPSAYTPDLVAIPLKSNITTYGPFYSSNFWTSSGGIDLIQDNDISPWTLGSAKFMETTANNIVNSNLNSIPEIETGSVNYPYWPEIGLGFFENGPNLTRVNCSFNSNGVSTNYNFQTFTPQFAKLASLEKQSLIESIKNQNKISRIARDKERKLDILRRKNIGPNNPGIGNLTLEKPISEQGTLHRILVGETYPFTQLWEKDQQNNYTITGSGDRTVVGTETLQKSVLELRYNYEKKAFMSLDGLYSPISISGDGDLPRFAVPNSSGGDGVVINNKFLNPLSNPGDWHYHSGVAAGHCIDIVGRGSGVPESGMIMNLYGQSKWDQRYTDDYRFLGLKGPLVLHSWGYDTDGMPIPNENDTVENAKSGVFTTNAAPRFFKDWLHKPSIWPVAPIDLRFDRERGVWVGGSGGSNIKIGKFCNQWPSLSNVKDPSNAVKKVVLYKKTENCEGESCSWSFEPVMITVSGVEVPQVVEAVNLFSNVAAAEYQTKWCAILDNGGTYILLAAEC